jgi:SAM-dependent methyltransferase
VTPGEPREPTRSQVWDGVAASLREPQFQQQLALYKRRETLDLIAAWAPRAVRTVLKTDLFEEGFGEDALLDALVGVYPLVVGMDISPVVAGASRHRMSGVHHVVSDAYTLPFRTGAFDLVVSVSTLDHLPPALLPRALAELARVLSPGGCAVLTLDSRHNPLHVFSNVLRRRLGRIHAERCYTIAEVRAALNGQPVSVTDTTAVYHVPFPVNFLAKRAERLAGPLAQRPITAVVQACATLAGLPTRFWTGRYIALRIAKPR